MTAGPGSSAGWRWHHGPITPGEAVVVDIDGVLSDASSRQHHLEGERRDWDAFFEASADDPVIEEVSVLLQLLDPALQVVLLTARPADIRDLTEEWLGLHAIRWDLLVTRPVERPSPAIDFKRAAIRDLREHGFVLRLAFEDDRRNVEMFRASGLPCVYLHSGYYD